MINIPHLACFQQPFISTQIFFQGLIVKKNFISDWNTQFFTFSYLLAQLLKYASTSKYKIQRFTFISSGLVRDILNSKVCVFSIKMDSFSSSCDVIEKAIKRYHQRIFPQTPTTTTKMSATTNEDKGR